ncbi:MAG: hypothetical protein CMK09_04285 [Ponticaulis sp.]|nr:hypothetical protein [Ponticaulis sp.]
MYNIYTTENDRETRAADIPQPGHLSRGSMVQKFENACRKIYDLEAHLDRVTETLKSWTGSLQDTRVVLLIDHSNSLNKHCDLDTLVTAVHSLEKFLLRAAIPYEVLGYTTDSWHGGKSRIDWMKDGSPILPGRLCDLLHVVYRSFDHQTDIPTDLSPMFHPDLLKENVDGEALEWAEQRLMAQQASHSIIVQFCDGVPVDDSTILENGEEFLLAHYLQVVGRLERESPVRLFGVGIQHDLQDYIVDGVTVETAEHAAEELLPAFSHWFANRPQTGS